MGNTGEETDIIKYSLTLDDSQQRLLHLMITDEKFWPGSQPPKDIIQLIKWAIDDYIDYYNSYRDNKKGE